MFKKIMLVCGYLIFTQSVFGITSSSSPVIVPARGTIEVAFSPNNGVTMAVVKAIDQAKKTILVEAYSFTSKDIATALLNAKKRGVVIQIILDKSQVSLGLTRHGKYSSATFFANLGFDLHIDYKHAIFHDKVMIIDNNTVVTGSFNFTRAAETKNAENLLILRDNPQLASLYTNEFNYNWLKSLDYNDFIRQKQ